MKSTLELLRELTARFPPGENKAHNVTLSPEAGCVLSVHLAAASRWMSITLLPDDYEKPIAQLIEEISRMVKEEMEWWTK